MEEITFFSRFFYIKRVFCAFLSTVQFSIIRIRFIILESRTHVFTTI